MRSPSGSSRNLRENGAAGLDGRTLGITATGAEAPPGDDVRSDSGIDGIGEVRQLRMYQLVRRKRLINDVTF